VEFISCFWADNKRLEEQAVCVYIVCFDAHWPVVQLVLKHGIIAAPELETATHVGHAHKLWLLPPGKISRRSVRFGITWYRVPVKIKKIRIFG
jgi:hypothetical protein